MISVDSLLSSTIGRVSPKYRTLDQWCETYRLIIAARPISEKTRANRRSAMNHVTEALGKRIISSIRPHEVAAMLHEIAIEHPPAAKRALFEARDIFAEAINYGWIDRNPAATIKPPVVRVRRNRLTLDAWWAILGYSISKQPPWVQRMLSLALLTGQRRSDLCKMRFSDVWDGYLHIEQDKTSARLALPLALRLDATGLSLEQVIEDCRSYAVGTEFMLRKHNGEQLVCASLSARFEEAREHATATCKTGLPASLHEIRSLSERLYRAEGINTMILLGHKSQKMTDLYNNDRGLSAGEWKHLALVTAH